MSVHQRSFQLEGDWYVAQVGQAESGAWFAYVELESIREHWLARVDGGPSIAWIQLTPKDAPPREPRPLDDMRRTMIEHALRRAIAQHESEVPR